MAGTGGRGRFRAVPGVPPAGQAGQPHPRRGPGIPGAVEFRLIDRDQWAVVQPSAGQSAIETCVIALKNTEARTQRLEDHPDRLKWNARYLAPKRLAPKGFCPLYDRAAVLGYPDGPVLELACGLSNQALALAGDGRDVLAVDISNVALDRLRTEAAKRGIGSRLTCVEADLVSWRPPVGRKFALVICVMYWEEAVFDYAWPVVADGGLIAWQGFTLDHLRYRPSQNPDWCFKADEPASRLPAGEYTVLHEEDVDEGHRVIRRMVARRNRS
ncbi:MAG: class I SAM-dependent methyltransferase [Gemmatimonadetes bacterium]|nr:class I SAM-dependent methyltransferase [Gemmatimonadota bacterium]MYG84476.1 class I SAM-dependent methyltransferase [Gemmatimonadota bacterium]MYJ89905.1 class I SAM-dependent methyltransferase [Gemmatimonadota bacterium]